MGLVLFGCAAIASLRYDGILASLAVTIAILCTMALAIVAFVARDVMRAFAIGFLAPMAVYATTVLVIGSSEYGPFGKAVLATTRMLDFAYPILSRQLWVDANTSKPITGKIDYAAVRNIEDMAVTTHHGATVIMTSSPSRATYLATGHVLVAVLLGYVGGKFGVALNKSQRQN